MNMGRGQPPKVKRYYGLHLISLIYKMLTVLTVILVLGGVGYISLFAVESRLSDWYDFNWWLPRAAALIVGGGILALTFYVLSQLVDIQIDHNRSLHEMVGLLKRQSKSLETLLAEKDTNNLLPTDLNQRKERVAARPQPAEASKLSTAP